MTLSISDVNTIPTIMNPTDAQLSVMKKRYLRRDKKGEVIESPAEMMERIADHIAKVEKTDEKYQYWKNKFLDILLNLQFLPNTPCIVNAGRSMGSLSACFVINVEDSIEGIFDAIKKAALIHKTGGGCIYKDVLVYTEKTGVISISDLAGQLLDTSSLEIGEPTPIPYQTTISYDPLLKRFTRDTITHIWKFDIPVENQRIVKTDGGTIRTSCWHPFILEDGTEVRADCLKPGDKLISISPLQVPIVTNIDDDMAWLVGYFIADGSLDETKNGLRLRFSDSSDQILDRASTILARKTGSPGCITLDPRENCKNLALVSKIESDHGSCNKEAQCLLKEFLNVAKPGSKYDTLNINQLRQYNNPAAILAGLMDGDGYIGKDKASYTTVFKPLAEFVQEQLSLLGIRSHIRTRKPHNWGKLPEYEVAWGVGWCKLLPMVKKGRDSRIYIKSREPIVLEITTPFDNKTEFYDFTVQNNNNYIAGENGFLLVHNTGFDFSSLRPADSDVASTHGIASGPVSFMRVFDSATAELKQGGVRRGANMGILHVNHPDIETFITAKLDNISLTNFNISVAITDDFMDAVINDKEWNLHFNGELHKTIKAKDLFIKIAECAWIRGEPGIVFIDRMNEDNYTEFIHGPINATNPCVTGDTKVLTLTGPKPIRDVQKGELVYAWDPESKLPVIRKSSGSRITIHNSPIIEVEFDSGLKVRCTRDHKFRTFRGDKIEAEELKIGQSIRAFSVSQHCDGHLRAHGWVGGRTAHQWVHRMIWEEAEGEIPEEYVIHHKDGDPTNNSIENLELLSAYDHQSEHYKARAKSGFGRHGRKSSESEVHKKISRTLKGKSKFKGNPHKVYENHKVVAIRDAGKEDVWNMTIEDVHTYIIVDPEYKGKDENGVYSGIVSCNCGEQPLHAWDSCNLGSINVSKFVTKREDGETIFDELMFQEVVRIAIRFLDNVVSANKYPLDEIEERTLQTRRIGLDIMGFADLLAKLGLHYDSEEAREYASYIMNQLYTTADEYSKELAEEKGPFPLWQSIHDEYKDRKDLPWRFRNLVDHPRRNSHLTTIAPTGSRSLIAGCSQGIEPIFSKKTTHKVLDGEEIKVEYEGNYKTADEITWEDHIRMQAAFQKYNDTSCSKTINMPSNATKEDVLNAYLLAYELGCRGITVYRDKSRDVQVLNRTEEMSKSNGDHVIEIKDHQIAQDISPLPARDELNARRIKFPSSAGSVLVVLGENPDEPGKLCETIFEIGKGGTVEHSLVEALGRASSLLLRCGIDPKWIVKQWIGISDGHGTFHNGQFYRSIPDGIARIILERYIRNSDTDPIKQELQKRWARCPECSAELEFSEGCVICMVCGYSKCG